MSENKRYYWLKLRRDFFKRHDSQIIESMENGKDYLLFYLKLLVESIDHEGALRFSDTIPYNEKMLSTITNTNIDIVRSAVKVLSELHLLDVMDNGTIFMNQVNEMIGYTTSEAMRKKQIRERRKLLQITESGHCPKVSEKRPPEIEIEIELDIEKDNIPEILIYWQTLYNQKNSTTIIPPEAAREQAFKLSQRIADIELLKKCADAFFDDSQGWFFTQSKTGATTKKVYYFKSFVSNIEALVSYVQGQKKTAIKQEEVKIPKPPLCPGCKKPLFEAARGIAGCKKCKVVFHYKNDKWIQEGI